jgi:hypothetical protein
MTDRSPQTDRIQELNSRIGELKARLPRHSVPPAMLMEMEDLEEELAQLLSGEKDGDAKSGPGDHA